MMKNQPIRILLIEDNPDQARLIAAYLAETDAPDIELIHVERLSMGHCLLREEAFDIVLLDLRLPDSDGLETLQKITQATSDLPIVVITSIDDETLAIQAVQMGAQDYLVKDQIDGRLLAQAIRYAIERKRLATTLRQSEELYRRLVQASPESIVMVDLEGTILYASPRSREQYWGENPQPLQGFNAFDITAPEDQQRAANDLHRTLQEGVVRGREYRFVRQDGSRYIGEVSAALIRDARGTPNAFIATIRDITERKAAENALRESEEMYRTLVQASPDAITVTDLEGRIIEVSDQAIEMHGCDTAEDLLQMTAFDLIAPEDRSRASENLRRTLEDGVLRNVEYRLLRRDGSRFLGQLSAALIRDAAGDPRAFIATVRDITKLKQAEVDLRESRERYRAVSELASDFTYTYKIEGDGTLVPEWIAGAYSRITGYSQDELELDAAGGWLTGIHPEDVSRIQESLSKILSGEPHALDIRITTKSGQSRWLHIQARPGWDEEKTRVIRIIGAARDITEQKEAKEALQKYTQRLEALHTVDLAILSAHSSQAIVQAALEHICELVPCQRVSVVEFHKDKGLATLLTSRSNMEITLAAGDAYPITAFPLEAGFDQGSARLVENLQELAQRSPLEETLLAEGIRAYANIPLVFQNEVIGSLNIGLDRTGRLEEEHLNIAQEIADLLAIAITQARLLESERRRIAELETLRQASLQLTSSLELQPVLEGILEHTLQLIDADDTHIFLYSKGILASGTAMWANGQRRPPLQPRPHGVTNTVARSGERIVIPKTDEHPLFEGADWSGAIAGLPLRIGERVVGVMNVAFTEPHQFDRSELRVLELLADQAAIAIENARLHEQARQHANELERRVADRTAELKRLVDLMTGREIRMAELKKVIHQLHSQLHAAGLTPIADDPLTAWKTEHSRPLDRSTEETEEEPF